MPFGRHENPNDRRVDRWLNGIFRSGSQNRPPPRSSSRSSRRTPSFDTETVYPSASISCAGDSRRHSERRRHSTPSTRPAPEWERVRVERIPTSSHRPPPPVPTPPLPREMMGSDIGPPSSRLRRRFVWRGGDEGLATSQPRQHHHRRRHSMSEADRVYHMDDLRDALPPLRPVHMPPLRVRPPRPPQSNQRFYTRVLRPPSSHRPVDLDRYFGESDRVGRERERPRSSQSRRRSSSDVGHGRHRGWRVHQTFSVYEAPYWSRRA